MGLSLSAAWLAALQRFVCRAARVHLISDVHERGCDLGLAVPMGAGRRARVERIAETGLIFVHIPKTAGMSVSDALYGGQVKHGSIRWLRHVDGGRLAGLPSFAVLREPMERFLSAYRYGRAGGGANNDVADPFRALYQGFRSIDDALDHVEQASNPYQVDHIFRPQHWYITDRLGRIAVDRLVRMTDLPRLAALVPGFPDRPLPCLNRSSGAATGLTAEQQARLRDLYAVDFALWERGHPLREMRTPARAASSPVHLSELGLV